MHFLDEQATGMAILSLAVVLGLVLGAVRVRGIRLGVSGVLFTSLLLGQFNLTLEPRVLEFLRDFALVLFVYTIGLQVGPGFVDSLKEEGLRLNLLAIAVLVLGACCRRASSGSPACRPGAPRGSIPARSRRRRAWGRARRRCAA